MAIRALVFCMTGTGNGAEPDRVLLTGDARERGRTHGESRAEEIRENVSAYLDVFEHYGLEESTVYDEAERFLELIHEENEEYGVEMRAIGEGAGIDAASVAVLNARYEIMYSAYADSIDEDPPPGDGCTAFAAREPATAENHTIIGQNWDWIPAINTFIMDLRRPDKPDQLVMTEAGIVGGKIGFNEHGIGMLLTGLVGGEDGTDPYRTPYHVRFREALDADRFDRAIRPFLDEDRANSANVVLAHEEGEMIDLELGPDTAAYLYPQDGLLVHANHFEAADVKSEFEKLLPDTLYRAPRLRRHLKKSHGAIDVETVQNELQDHFGKPASICYHPDPTRPSAERERTNGSYVIDLTEKRLYATAGPPCESPYATFEMDH